MATSLNSVPAVAWSLVGAAHRDIAADPDQSVQLLLKAALTDHTDSAKGLLTHNRQTLLISRIRQTD